MDLINIAILIALAINLVFTVVLHYHAHRSRPAYSFRFVGLAVSAWCISMFIYRFSSNSSSFFWAKMLYMSASFIPSLFSLFCLSLPNNKVKKTYVIIVLIVNGILAFLCTLNNFIISGVSTPPTGEKIIEFALPGYALYMVYVPAFFILSFFILLKKYSSANSLERAQLRYILAGSIITSNIAMFSNLLLPSLGVFSLNWLGQLSTIVWFLFVGYTILKHRLFGIKLVIGKAIYLVLFSATIYSLFYAYYLIQEKFIGEIYRNITMLSGFLIVVTITIVLFNVSNRLKRTINYYIIYRNYDPEKIREQLTHNLSNSLTYKEATEHIISTIQLTIKPKRADLYVFKTHEASLRSFSREFQTLLERQCFTDVIIEEEITDTSKNYLLEIKSALEKTGIKAVFPIALGGNALGQLLLGEKEDLSAYTLEEIEFIKSLTDIVATTFDRIHLHEKSKQLAVLKAEKTREQEIIDIMGHELRTPATVAKMAIEQALAEINRNSANKAELKETLKLASSGIDRQYALAQRYVTAARLAKGAFKLNKTKTDLTEIATRTKEQFDFAAKEKNISIKIASGNKKIPKIKADPQAIQQVFSNLLENAIKYSEKGTITIELKTEKESIRTSITDQGPGIPATELPNLGKKFYRAKGRQKLTVPGTGLGLYVVFGTIKAHGGKVEIKSRVGEGATFSFTLPR